MRPGARVPGKRRFRDSMKYLVDSDWTIDHLNGVHRVVSRLGELAEDGLGLSVISLAEVYEGIFYSSDPPREELALQNFLRGISIVELDDEICRIFARERGRLRAAGNIVGDFDLLIGATALRHGLTLLSNNRNHFERIQGLTIISV